MTAPLDAQETAALEAALLAAAGSGTTLAYAELAGRIGLRPPHRIHRLTLALEARLRQDHAAGRPLLAAVAVGRLGVPGRGFFQLLSKLGRYQGPDQGVEAARHFAKERDRAFAYWSRAGGLSGGTSTGA